MVAVPIKITRVERPGEYPKICASLVPQAFEDDARLQVAITQIVRTIIDPNDKAVPLPKTESADEAIEGNIRFCGRYWGKADMLYCTACVCLTQSGHRNGLQFNHLTP